MKKINNYSVYFLLILCLGFMASCDNDEIVPDGGDLALYNGINPQNNYAYILDTEGENEKSIVAYKLQATNKGVTYTGKSKVFLQVGLTRALGTDLSLDVKVDESLVAAFNKANETDYKLLPENGYQLLNSKAMIKSGFMKSDSVKFVINDKVFTKSENYVLPVKIVSTDNVLASNNRGVVYFTFSVQEVLDNIETATALVPGKAINRQAWGITCSSNNGSAKNLLDDDNSTASMWWTYSSSRPIIDIDMGKQHTVKGMTIVAADGWLSGKPKLVSVATSADGKLWTIQGKAENTDTTNKEFFIELKKPVKTQYLKIQILEGNGSYIVLGTINIIE